MVISMDRWKGKVAIVTGASAGIGAAVVENLVQAGVCVAGLARRKEKVEQLATKLKGASGKLYAVQADVSKEADILAAFKWVRENLGPVHILVNNAGIVRGKGLTNGDTAAWREVFDTNVLALCIATREAVKDMQASKVNGHIIHINSTVGHTVPNFPDMNVYPASKYAVTALTETLRQELNHLGSKIKVTSISPGGVRTEIADAGGISTGAIGDYLKSPGVLDPNDIAEAIIYVLSTPPHVQVHELTIKPVGELA